MAKYNPLLGPGPRSAAADRKAAAAARDARSPRYVTDDGYNPRPAAASDHEKVLELAKSLSKPFVLDSTYTKVAYCGETNLRLQNLVNQRAKDVVYYGGDGSRGFSVSRSFVDLLIEATEAYANHITDNEELLIRGYCYHDADTLRAAAALLRLHSVSGVVHPRIGNPRKASDVPKGFVLTDNGGRSLDRYTIIYLTPNHFPGYGNSYIYFGFSENPSRGFGQHGELKESDIQHHKRDNYRGLGKRINLSDLPPEARQHAEEFIRDCTVDPYREGNPAASRFVLLDAGYDEGWHGAHERYTLICTTPQGSGSRTYYNLLGFGPGVSGHGELTASDFRALKAEGYRSLGRRIKVEALPPNYRHLAERFIADC